MSRRLQKMAEELSMMAVAARRRAPKRKPVRKAPPSKMVTLLGSRIIKALGTKPYKVIEETAADEGQIDTSRMTLGWFASHSELRPMSGKIEKWVGDWVYTAVNKRSLNGVSWDRFTVEVDFDTGVMSLEGKLEGAEIFDPDQDVEVPDPNDLDDYAIGQGLRALGATKVDVTWRIDGSTWDDINQVSYKVRATWDFDPVVLAQKTLDTAKVAAAVARGVAKHEK